MRDELIFEEGERCNLAFNKRRLKGWILVLTKNDKEYLIKQNFIIMRIGNYKFKRKYYQVVLLQSLKRDNMFLVNLFCLSRDTQ